MKISTTAIFGPLLLLTYGAIFLYAVVAYLIVGHWPSYGNPDPSSLPISWFFGLIIMLLILASLISVVVYPFLSVADLRKGTSKMGRFWAYAAIFMYATIAILIMGQDVTVQYPDSQPDFNPFPYLVILPSLIAVVVYLMMAVTGQRKEILGKWHFWAYLIGFGLWVLDSCFFQVMNPQQGGLLDWLFD